MNSLSLMFGLKSKYSIPALENGVLEKKFLVPGGYHAVGDPDDLDFRERKRKERVVA